MNFKSFTAATVAGLALMGVTTAANAAPSISEYEAHLRSNTEMLSGIRTICVSMGMIKMSGSGAHQVWLRRHLNESGMDRDQQLAFRNVIKSTCPGHF